jgi:bifunctional UDP-N-acetylglucosamine pyrophosphorylase/glucosamine-1-phosphate N-acetyltransferase
VIIKNSKIGERCYVKAYSYIDGSSIASHGQIGPFAHLRPGSVVGSHCKVGNFVEIKKSHLQSSVKVSHLSYIGDAQIGENTNIGCGFITCNYDGSNKHKTIIGKNVFIGSDCQAVAPLTIGDDSFVAAGTTITLDVPEKAFSIARVKQVIKENMASRFIKK